MLDWRPARRARRLAEHRATGEARRPCGGVVASMTAESVEPGAADARESLGEDPAFRVEDRGVGGRHTLHVSGPFALGAIDTFDVAVARLWARETTSISAIVLDLREVTFIDSSGLWAISNLQKWCARGSVRFGVLRGPDTVHRVFEVTGLSDVFPFVEPPDAEVAT